MGEQVISVENLSKRYRIGAKEQGFKTFTEVIAEAFTAPIRNLNRLKRLTKFDDVVTSRSTPNPVSRVRKSAQNDIIWALRDVSFEVKQGEILGIIGRNGAGKSTLLKILSRITEPTTGDVKIYGRISSLLEVGTGFHPELTGRENIFLNGAILGMRKQEINRQFDEIVAFAEIEKFIDTPVKYYSSGMYVRLAFAVGAHLEPEILIVDEVLAVGDLAFQNKCLSKMDSASQGGRTAIFVTHNLGMVEKLCGRTILLEQGSVIAEGRTSEVISRYLQLQCPNRVSGTSLIDHPGRRRGSEVIMREARLYTNGQETNIIRAGDSMKIEVSFKRDKPMAEMHIGITVKNAAGERMTVFHSYLQAPYLLPQGVSEGKILCEIPRLHLMPGSYHLTFSLHKWGPKVEELDRIDRALAFTVQDVDVFGWGQPIRSGMDMAFFEDAKWGFEGK